MLRLAIVVVRFGIVCLHGGWSRAHYLLCAPRVVRTVRCADCALCALRVVRTARCAHWALCALRVVRTARCAHPTHDQHLAWELNEEVDIPNVNTLVHAVTPDTWKSWLWHSNILFFSIKLYHFCNFYLFIISTVLAYNFAIIYLLWRKLQMFTSARTFSNKNVFI